MKNAFYNLFLFLFLGLLSGSVLSQNEAAGLQKMEIPKINVFNPSTLQPSFNPQLTNLEAPVPGGKSYRAGLRALRKEVRKKHPLKTRSTKSSANELSKPQILSGYKMARYIPAFDDTLDVTGGTPLDNTLAMSNTDYLMAGINSTVFCQKLDKRNVSDTIVTWSFANFAGNVPTENPFDPKIIYDPEEDRFIATFLTGRVPSNSGLVIAFSQSSNPFGDWAVYLLPGNPLNDTSWSDYPAITVTKKEIFYTINLLVPSANWKTAFKRSVIWQIDKFSGYQGQANLKTNLWSEIAHNGRYLRNLAVVHGGDGLLGPGVQFLSNRNFDISNDSIFMVEIPNEIDNSAPSDLKVRVLMAKNSNGNAVNYGLPPYARQEDSNNGDPEEGFDTNDSRILGAFKKDNTIQFVGNCVDSTSGRAGFYHGIVEQVSTSPTLLLNIIGNDSLDLGYPNIVFTGNDSCTTSSLIAFNHTSPTHYAGTSVMRYSNGSYSPIEYLKEGLNYVDRISGPYERWGDYYGLQRNYNEPGVVWAAGFYGREDGRAVTWLSEIRDCDCFDIRIEENPLTPKVACDGFLNVNVMHGVPPYSYSLFNKNGTSVFQEGDTIYANLCDSNNVLVSDSKGCTKSLNSIVSSDTVRYPKTNPVMYPNPVMHNEVNIYFTLPSESFVKVLIFGVDGKLAHEINLTAKADQGANLLTFSTSPLSSGVYIVKVYGDNDEVYQGKLVKP